MNTHSDLQFAIASLEKRGFSVSVYDTAPDAARAIADSISGKTVGMGGSITLEQLELYPLLERNNPVFWHWKTPGAETLQQAAQAQVYLTSANAIAETGEIVNIDGTGNRVSAMLYGHERVIIVAGVNKLAENLDAAIYRARNTAAPLNARRLHRQTPCALLNPPQCHDCRSPERICRAMSIITDKPHGVDQMEVIFIRQPLGY